MKKEKVYAQHGDVNLYECMNIPKTSKLIKATDGFVVEKGEGIHTHVIKEIKRTEIYEDNGVMYLHVKEQIELDHEEHGIKVIEPGIYRKEIENEFDYETEEARKTKD